MSINNLLTFPRVRTPDSNRTVMWSGNSESEGIPISGQRLDIYFCYLYLKIFNLHLYPELRKTRRKGIKWINKSKDEQEKPKQQQMVDSKALPWFWVYPSLSPFQVLSSSVIALFLYPSIAIFFYAIICHKFQLIINLKLISKYYGCARLIMTSVPEHLQNIVVEL